MKGGAKFCDRTMLIERMHEAIETTGPGSAIRIQGSHNHLHKNGRTTGKLVTRINDRVRVDAKIEQYVIGWDDGLLSESISVNFEKTRQIDAPYTHKSEV